jgi:hypothetical protein
VVLSENEDSLKPLPEWVSHDVLHHSGALWIKPSSMAIDHVPEISDSVKEYLEYALNLLFQCLKFRVVKVHDLEVGEDLQQLFVQILGDSIHQKNSPGVGVAVTASSDLPELVEDQIDGSSDLLEGGGGEQTVDWEVPQESVEVSGGLQLGVQICVQLEAKHEFDLVRLLKKLSGHLEHRVL